MVKKGVVVGRFLGSMGGVWGISDGPVVDNKVEALAVARRFALAVSTKIGRCMNSPRQESERTSYSRAVLAIKTPVSVTLARKNCSLERIMDLVPGAMLTFDAHCDEPLTLEAGGQAIATGEAVKIGDKFGLRIRNVLLGQQQKEDNA